MFHQHIQYIIITYIYIMYIETGDSGIFFGHIHPCSLVVLSDSISGGAINGRSMGTKLDTQQLWWFPAKSDLSISGSQSPELWPIVGCCRFKPPLHFRTVWESMATENVVWVFATVQSCSIHILGFGKPQMVAFLRRTDPAGPASLFFHHELVIITSTSPGPGPWPMAVAIQVLGGLCGCGCLFYWFSCLKNEDFSYLPESHF